jgi:hypothetical protein
VQQGTQYLTEKDGASITAHPAGYPPAIGSHNGGQVFPRISHDGRAFYYRGDLRTHRTVAEIDSTVPARPQEGAGVTPLSGSGANHFNHIAHGA